MRDKRPKVVRTRHAAVPELEPREKKRLQMSLT